MKAGIWLLVVLVAVPLCSFSPVGTRAQTPTSGEGMDAVEVIQAIATVQKIDLQKRKVTLLFDDGKHKTYKVDKSVQNLDKVTVGDHLQISFTEEIAVLIGQTGEKPGAAPAGAVGVTAKGKPDIFMADTEAFTARILAVDPAKHRVTLEEPNGKKKSVKLGKNADVSQLAVGDTVDVVIADSLVVDIVK